MSPSATGKSSTGIDENLAGALAYVLGLVSGLLFLVLGERNRFVRFHALQSVYIFTAVLIAGLLVRGLPLARVLTPLFTIAVAILWVTLMVRAFSGERFKLPLVGDWADQQTD